MASYATVGVCVCVFVVVCDFCDAINSEANGPISEVLSFIRTECDEVCVCVLVCLYKCTCFHVSDAINLQTDGPILQCQR